LLGLLADFMIEEVAEPSVKPDEVLLTPLTPGYVLRISICMRGLLLRPLDRAGLALGCWGTNGEAGLLRLGLRLTRSRWVTG